MIVDLTMMTSEIKDDYTPQMRGFRNRLLRDSDWAMMPDAPTNKAAWAAYRQSLRDFPATWTPGPEANFPEAPTE